MTILIGLIVSIALSLVCFVSTSNLITTAVIGGVSLIYFLFYVKRVLNLKNEQITRFQCCYQFINNFLIALSIKEHISGALASALESQNPETVELMRSIDSNDPLDKVKYIKDYFRFDIYSLFVDLVTLYSEEGGEIIKMSQYLLNQIREDEEYLINAERLNQKAVIEFSILWVFSLMILVILRLALQDFFSYIVKSSFYQISVVCILFFALISIHIAVCKITNIKIKGWTRYE